MFFEKGLILEGGGMRGLYTCGVLDFFLEKDLEFKDVYGVSAGACHGCSYVSKQKGRAFATSTKYVDDKNYCSIHSLIKTGDLFNAKMLYDTIPNELEPFDFETFGKRKCRLFAVVCNCETGLSEYHLLTDMKRDIVSVRASASMPLVSRLVDINGKKYLDGGITDSIPIKKSIENGCSSNVVILTQPKGYRKEKNSAIPLIKAKYRKYPGLVKAMENRHIVYNDTLDFIEEEVKDGRCFVIQPKKAADFRRIEKDINKLTSLYTEGYNDAAESYGALMDFLGK